MVTSACDTSQRLIILEVLDCANFIYCFSVILCLKTFIIQKSKVQGNKYLINQDICTTRLQNKIYDLRSRSNCFYIFYYAEWPEQQIAVINPSYYSQ